MKETVVDMQIVRVTFILLFVFPAHLVISETLTLRADPWYPYNGYPESEKPGYIIEVARMILKKHDIKLDYQILEWEMSLRQARSGDIDCVVGAYKTDAPDFIYPSQALGVDIVAFFARSDAPDWQYENLSSLYNKRIGVIAAYSYGEDIDRFIAANADTQWLHISRGDDPLARNIRMVLAGRLDMLIESHVVLKAKLQEMKLTGQIKMLDQLPAGDKLYIACSPENPESKRYVRLLDEGLIQLRNTGKLDTILAAYGLQDWQQN